MPTMAAIVWIVYGVIIGAGSVIVCNVAVALMATVAAYRYTMRSLTLQKKQASA